MPLNPQAKAVLDIMAQMGVSLTGDDPQAVRDQLASFPRPEGEVVGSVVDRTVPGPAGEIAKERGSFSQAERGLATSGVRR